MKQLPGLLRLAVVGIPASVASSRAELHNCRRWSLFPAQFGIGRSRHPPMKEKPALLRFRGRRDPRLHRQFPHRLLAQGKFHYRKQEQYRYRNK